MTLKQVLACRNCKRVYLKTAEEVLHLAIHEGAVSAHKSADWTDEEVLTWYFKQTDNAQEVLL